MSEKLSQLVDHLAEHQSTNVLNALSRVSEFYESVAKDELVPMRNCMQTALHFSRLNKTAEELCNTNLCASTAYRDTASNFLKMALINMGPDAPFYTELSNALEETGQMENLDSGDFAILIALNNELIDKLTQQ
ncbi:hypothetical protein KBC75_03815 [Candidatus Shapirobacteria bacterium]|nr:hypothetical protein [Candidatus Shapirobacteria bacterium]